MNDDDDLVGRGRQLAMSAKYQPPRGKHLGRIDVWGMDVYEGSPPHWKDALLAEVLDAQ